MIVVITKIVKWHLPRERTSVLWLVLEIELGTKVIILGREFTCEDRTALRFNGRYDIFMGYGQEAYNKAVNFGIKELPVIYEKR